VVVAVAVGMGLWPDIPAVGASVGASEAPVVGWLEVADSLVGEMAEETMAPPPLHPATHAARTSMGNKKVYVRKYQSKENDKGLPLLRKFYEGGDTATYCGVFAT
jgi:hypothetical protein